MNDAHQLINEVAAGEWVHDTRSGNAAISALGELRQMAPYICRWRSRWSRSRTVTIVGMAAFDFHARRNGRLPSPWLRLSLVFGCALIHGLGLASALSELGLDRQHHLPSLTGFNVGIELGQVAVAGLAGSFMWVVRRMRGGGWRRLTTRLASWSAPISVEGRLID